MRVFAPILALLLFSTLAGCDPDPVKVELLAYDAASDSYTFQTVTLETIDDVGELDGRATSLIGGAAFTYDLRDGVLTWDSAGYPAAFGAVEVDGVLIPEDFDSLAMVSIYYGIELSLLFFEDMGLPRGALVHPETYYWPRFKTIYQDGETEIVTDNAYFMYMSKKDRAFFVFPFEQFQWIPMSMNSGILTHEFSHAVFDQLVDEPNRAVIAQMETASRNFLYGLNEGWADYIAAARTGDPDFMSHTAPQGIFGIQCNSDKWAEMVRNVAAIHPYDAEIDAEARAMAVDEFCPYDVGLFFASTMYGLARALDGHVHNDYHAVPTREAQERVARWLYATMDGLGQTLALDFELWDLFGLMVELADSGEERALLCETLAARYFMHYSAVEGC
jgi:hypothetical protein